MITVFSKKLLFLSLIACSLSTTIHAMKNSDSDTTTAPISFGKKSESAYDLGYRYTQSFFNGWKPTLAFAGCATAYCLRYDRQAPIKALAWLKDSFVETPKLVAYPAAFLGMCCAYSYYKPRVDALVYRIKSRNFSF